MPRRNPPAARRPLAAPFLLAGAVALGANTPLARAQTDAPPPADAAAVTLADHAIVLQSLGLSIRLPIGATYEATRMTGANAGFTMTSPDKAWRLLLLSPTSRDQSLTPAAVADSLIQELRQSRVETQRDPRRNTDKVVGSGAVVLDRADDVKINGLSAARFYISIPNGVKDSTLVSGYTVFQVGPGRFAILQMDCLEPTYKTSRAAYETVVASAEFRDPADMAAERAAGVRAADQFLSGLNKQDLVAVLPAGDQFHRIFKPASTGAASDAKEIAWQRTSMRVGKRGELDPQKSPKRYTSVEQQEGFLVSVAGRYIDGDRFVDSESICFLTFDRTEEAWAVRMTVKEGKKQAGYTETGVRVGDDLKVQVAQSGQNPTERKWKKPPEAYLSQVESYLLPRLMASRIGAPTVLNFYRYQSATGEMTLRRDVMEPAPMSGASDGAAAWLIRTRPDENASEETTLINSQGDILRREKADGVVMEPITLEALQALWKRKGLPMS